MATFKLQKWEKTRAKGKRRFLLINGVLIPALGFSLLALFIIIRRPGNLFMPGPARNETPKIIFLLPMLYACVGFTYYSMAKVWNSNEKAYKAALEGRGKVERTDSSAS